MDKEIPEHDDFGVVLSPKRQKFCQEYVKDFNATQAAIRSGYAENSAGQTGYDLLKNPQVMMRIEELKIESAKAATITKEWVVTQLQEVARRCLQAEPVKGPGGRPIKDESGAPVYAFKESGATKALELIGKHLAMFTDNVNANHSGERPVVNVTIGYVEQKKEDGTPAKNYEVVET